MEKIEDEQKKEKEKPKRKSAFITFIHNRVLVQNKNFMMVVVGATGSGKSYSCMALGEALDPTFNIERVCFKAEEFVGLIKKLTDSKKKEEYRGKVILWDELGVEQNSREFMTLSNRIINYFFQTSRHLNLIILMTVPLISFVDISMRQLVHAMGEMTGINFLNKSSTIRIKFIQTNVMTAKTYKKFLRVYQGGKFKVLKNIRVGLPSKKLLGEYELKKKKYTTDLYSEIMEKLKPKDKKNKEGSEDSSTEDIVQKPLTELQEKIIKVWRGGETNMTEIGKVLGRIPSTISRNVGFIRRKGYELKRKNIVDKKKREEQLKRLKKLQGYKLTKKYLLKRGVSKTPEEGRLKQPNA